MDLGTIKRRLQHRHLTNEGYEIWEIHKNYVFQNVAAATDVDMFNQWPESEIYH
jgi:hypothetical protein